MKILVVSHSCVVRENQKKADAMARIKGVELTLLIPDHWRDTLREVRAEKTSDPSYEIITSPVYFNGRIAKHLYPVVFAASLLRRGFDYVLVEEEPVSLAAFEFILLNRIFSRSRTAIFTWENIFIEYGFPKSLIERFVLKNTGAIIAGNTRGMEVLVRKGYRGRLSVIPLIGIDTESFKKSDSTLLREKYGLGAAFTVGYLGRLVEEKGLINLVEAAASLKGDVKCVMIGRGPLKDALVSRIAALGAAGRFVFIDSVAHHEVPEFINMMDCLVLPSITVKDGWREQFGHVLIEAMSCEVPVIGSDSGAIPEVIANAGLIFREGDSRELAQKITALMEDNGLHGSLAKKGRQRALDEYTHYKVAQNTCRALKDIP